MINEKEKGGEEGADYAAALVNKANVLEKQGKSAKKVLQKAPGMIEIRAMWCE